MAFVFRLQTLWLKHFSKIYQLKCLKPKNKGHSNFYECCDLTKKIIPCSSMRSLSFWIMGKERGLLSKNIHCLILLLSTRWCFYHIMHIAESEKNGLPADKIGQKKWTKMGQFWQSLYHDGMSYAQKLFLLLLSRKKDMVMYIKLILLRFFLKRSSDS